MSSQEAIAIMNTASSAEPKLREKPLSPAMLRELSARSDARGAIRTISHYGAVAIVGTLSRLTSSITPRTGSFANRE